MESGLVGVVVAGHGPLGEALVASSELIVGSQGQLAWVGLEPLATLESLQADIGEAVDRVDRGEGVLVLIDLFGGTPGTAAAMSLRDRRAGLVAGVNLPMLLEVLLARDQGGSVESLTAVAVEAGAAGIQDMGARLGLAGASKEHEGSEED